MVGMTWANLDSEISVLQVGDHNRSLSLDVSSRISTDILSHAAAAQCGEGRGQHVSVWVVPQSSKTG